MFVHVGSAKIKQTKGLHYKFGNLALGKMKNQHHSSIGVTPNSHMGTTGLHFSTIKISDH